MLVAEKPGSPAEVLEHVGVKGMRWGVRRSTRRARSSETHPTGKQFGQKYKTGHSRAKEIHRARAANFKRKKAYENEKDMKKKIKLEAVYLNHPDRVTALRLTRGEKVAAGIIAGTIGFGAPIAIGVGANRAYRARVTSKQIRKKY